MSSSRRDQLATALQAQQERIQQLSGQTPAGIRGEGRLVRLLPVTKFFPAEDVALLHELGVRSVGENRDQEASAKAASLGASGLTDLEWHFIGQLQSKKAKSVVTYASWVHSLDRESVVRALGRAMDAAAARWEAEEGPRPAAGDHLNCLIQIDLDPQRDPRRPSHRGGAHPGALEELAEQIAEHPRLHLAGVMAVAPQDVEAEAAFQRLWELSAALRCSHPQAQEISAGMSGDVEAAIRWGSTLVRMGSAIMGSRPSPDQGRHPTLPHSG